MEVTRWEWKESDPMKDISNITPLCTMWKKSRVAMPLNLPFSGPRVQGSDFFCGVDGGLNRRRKTEKFGPKREPFGEER